MSNTSHAPIELIPQGPRCTVWLNRPERHNAFDAEVISMLTEAFEGLAQEPDLRVVVLAARGGSFCAGADLRWMRAMADTSEADNLRDAQQLAQLLWTVHHCPVPVLAQVNGEGEFDLLALVQAERGSADEYAVGTQIDGATQTTLARRHHDVHRRARPMACVQASFHEFLNTPVGSARCYGLDRKSVV